MLICHCHRISDRTILACAADGARTVAQVGRLCGAGTGCGGCAGAIRDVLASARRVLPVVSAPVVAEPVLAATG